jgi:hypothetical protein
MAGGVDDGDYGFVSKELREDIGADVWMES